MITVENLTKVYRTFTRREGIFGGLLDLLHRDYRETLAVDGVSFSVERGEIIGYIGSNGAGKSTTIKMLTGILRPTSGHVSINGLVPWKQRTAHVRNIGVLFGQRTQLFWDIAVIESFRLLRKMYDVHKVEFDGRLKEMTELLDLGPLLNKPTRKLSLGQRMRCDFAASLLHDPPVIFLDEPTIGLDVSAKFKVRDAIRHIALERGKTVLLTTHDLTDVEDLCQRIIIIDNGRIIFNGSIKGIKERMGKVRKALIDFHDTVSASSIMQSFDGSSVDAVQRAPNQVELTFATESISPSDLMRRILSDFNVQDFVLKGPELSDIVRKIYDGETAIASRDKAGE